MNVFPSRSAIAWRFGEQPPRSRENEPTQEEFFSNESLITEVASLVRESIQNSLDERLDTTRPIKVRFKLGLQKSENLKRYFGELIPHASLVIPHSIPDLNESAKYLVIEDFNTLGLEGSTSSKCLEVSEQEKLTRGFKDSYWFFEWKTGKSNKASGKRGSWGVGKIVFPRASALKTYLVFSERRQIAAPDGDPQILFGHCILNFRNLAGKRFVPDCQWMTEQVTLGTEETETIDLVPSKDLHEHEQFKVDWKLARKDGDTGTSIVVPFVNVGMSSDQLLHSIAQDYFITILSEMLICEVEDEEGIVVKLDRESLIPFLEERVNQETFRSRTVLEMVELCRLYEMHLNGETSKFEISAQDEFPNDWSNYSPTDDFASNFRKHYEENKLIEVKINATVPKTKKGDSKQGDAFVALLKHSEGIETSTVFCREGILIPGANTTSTKDTISIVLVGSVGDSNAGENTLATLLKNAEGPSHEKWTVTASHFKGLYTPEVLGNKTVDWVKRSVQSLLRIIRKEDVEADSKELSRFFPDPEYGRSTPVSKVRLGDSEKIKNPKVLLSASKTPGNPRAVQLTWANFNLTQDEYVLSIIEPTIEEISSGNGETSFLHQVDQNLSSITFQVAVKAGENITKSNVKRIQFLSNQRDPQLIASRSGDSVIIQAEDISMVTNGMRFEVELGYSVRGGSTFGSDSVYDLEALKLFQPGESHGAVVSAASEQNVIRIDVSNSNFEVVLRGFNPLLDPAMRDSYKGVFQ